MFRDFTKYEIYEDGSIWSYVRNNWLRSSLSSNGYARIKLSDNNGKQRRFLLHRVVYEAVTGQPIPEGLQVNHIDEDKTNNQFNNLNLMTPKENSNWGTRNERLSKVQSKQVEQYDLEGNLIKVWPSLSEINRQLGYSCGNICDCCKGKFDSRYGFKWKYAS